MIEFYSASLALLLSLVFLIGAIAGAMAEQGEDAAKFGLIVAGVIGLMSLGAMIF